MKTKEVKPTETHWIVHAAVAIVLLGFGGWLGFFIFLIYCMIMDKQDKIINSMEKK